MASSTPTPPISTGPDDAREDDAAWRVLLIEVEAVAYALPVAQVREVLRRPVITPIPRAPAPALGLVNVRGLVVTVLDLASLLAMPAPGSSTDQASEPARARATTDTPRAEDARRDDTVPLRDATTPMRRVGLGESIVLLSHRGRAVGVRVDAVHGVVPLEGERASGDSPAQHGDRVQAAGREAICLDADCLLAPVMLMAEEGR